MTGQGRLSWLWKMIAMAAVVLTLEGLFFRGILVDPDALIGDPMDSRFNNLVVEHWYQAFQGKEPVTDIAIFFPVKGTLGYSDALLGFALPYSFLRVAGLDLFWANKAVLLLVHLLGSVGILLLLVRGFRVDWKVALIGAVMFSFSSAFLVKSVHTQLFFFSVLPYIGISAISFWRRRSHFSWRRMIDGLVTTGLLAIVLLTSFYVAFFVALFGTVCLVVFGFSARANLGSLSRSLATFVRTNALEFTVYGLVLLAAALSFLMIYLPAFIEFGKRPWAEIRPMVPQIADLVNASPESVLWGSMLTDFVSDISTRPNYWELQVGWPLGTFLLVAGVFWNIVRPRNKGPYSISGDDNTARVLVVLTLGVLITLLLIIRVEGFSLWWFVHRFVPGAGGIRAVSRFFLFLTLPIAIVVVVYLDRRLRLWTNRRLATAVVVLLIVGLGVDNLHRRGVVSTWERSTMIKRLETTPPPPADCEVVYRYDPSVPDILNQIEGWMVAGHFGLKTINGYSGQFPASWQSLGLGTSSPQTGLPTWVKLNKVDNAYIYNASAGTWTKIVPDLSTVTRVGFVDDTWTTGKAWILGLSLSVEKDQELVLDLYGWRPEILSGDMAGLRVFANGQRLELDKRQANSLYYVIPNTMQIKEIILECRTFVPGASGMSSDSRSLGVDLKDFRIVDKGN